MKYLKVTRHFYLFPYSLHTFFFFSLAPLPPPFFLLLNTIEEKRSLVLTIKVSDEMVTHFYSHAVRWNSSHIIQLIPLTFYLQWQIQPQKFSHCETNLPKWHLIDQQLLATGKLEQWFLDRLVWNENIFDNNNFNLYFASEDSKNLPTYYYFEKAEKHKDLCQYSYKILMAKLWAKQRTPTSY